MTKQNFPPSRTALTDRAVLAVDGEDARDFLQGIVTNDIDKVAADNAIYAALLTPQGKYLHDFFVFEIGGVIHLDCDAARVDDLNRRLRLYKLRAKVEIGSPALTVHALFGDGALGAAGLTGQPGICRPLGSGVVFTDPRLPAVGARAVGPDGVAADIDGMGFGTASPEAYDGLRIRLGLPGSGTDLVADKSLLLECGFEELGGVDFEKGCYVGQEVTARMKHRNLVRKRLLPVSIEGTAPPPGTPILLGDVTAGELRGSANGSGIALLRLDQVDAAEKEGSTLKADGITIVPQKLDWMNF